MTETKMERNSDWQKHRRKDIQTDRNTDKQTERNVDVLIFVQTDRNVGS